MKESLSYIVERVQEILEAIDANGIEEIVNSIISARAIFIYGVGRSGLVGKSFAIRLVQLGLNVHLSLIHI